MRQNKWNVEEAADWVAKAGDDEADRELALRVYSSRLIGADPDLVQHGGGNTSVKLTRKTLFGEPVQVLHVKGSGWDLDSLLAPGLPGVRMEPLMKLRQLDRLSDEDMVNIQRSSLIDSTAPNPSVETLLHAYLPHTYVDHTHATAFLALANLPDAEKVIAEIFGDRLAVVPFIMPGFDLARKAAAIYDANPDVEGMVLLQHGHFTFGPTARESYDRVISHTNEVEEYLAGRVAGRTFSTSVNRLRAPIDAARVAAVLPVLRGAIAKVRGDHHGTAPIPVIMDVRSGPVVEEFLDRADLDELATRGVGSPDHVIRAKGEMLNLDRSDVEGGAAAIQAKVDAFVEKYRARFDAQNKRLGGVKVMLEPHPCAAWIHGVGVVGIGKDANVASATADILEQNIEVMTFGEAVGEFRPVSSEELFEMEYWSLEQAKLAGAKSKEFAGQVVLVTGGAGAIGFAIAKTFASLGATLAIVDRDGAACQAAAAKLGKHALAIEADLTAKGAADDILQQVASRFGGLDILVSNAGAAIAGSILDMDEAVIRSSFELNFFSHLSLARAASAIFAAQGKGGQMLFNVSKQAVNPGKGFGAYGLPKAATFFLVRQLALELGERGIRVNGVNADRIRSGLLTDDFIQSRAKSRGVSTDQYMAGNLLKAEVEASHVADAFVALARSERTTAHVITVDGGNIEAALR